MKRRYLALVFALIALIPLSSSGDEDLQWRQKFKRARYRILIFNVAVTNYYNSMLFSGQVSPKEKKMLIDGSIGARHSLNSLEGCPDEYIGARDVYNEIYEDLRKMELMATSQGVAKSKFEEQKELKKSVDMLIDKYEELLKLK